MKSKFSEQDFVTMEAFYEYDFGISRIAKMFRTSIALIRHHFKRNRGVKLKPGTNIRRISDEDMPKVIEMYLSGINSVVIGKMFHASPQTILKWLMKNGVSIRHAKLRGARKDLTGKIFGRLTVIAPHVDNKYQ